MQPDWPQTGCNGDDTWIAQLNVVNVTSVLLLTVDDQGHACMLQNASTALTVTIRSPT